MSVKTLHVADATRLGSPASTTAASLVVDIAEIAAQSIRELAQGSLFSIDTKVDQVG